MLPAGDLRGGRKVVIVEFVASRENVRQGGVCRMSELFRASRLVDQGGETKDWDASSVLEAEIYVRVFNVGGVLDFSGCGGGVDRGCSSVDTFRRHGHGAVIEHDQSAKTFGRRGDINQRRDHFPLAAYASDLGDARSPALVRGGPGAAGSVGVQQIYHVRAE